MLGKLKRIVRRALGKVMTMAGLVPQSMPQAPEDTMEGAIQALARRGYSFNTIVDVGASNGSWTRLAMKHFPNSHYLLIEAQPVHEEALVRFSREDHRVAFTLAAAGETVGRIFFDAGDPLGGQASLTPYEKNNIEVPVTTIDHQVRARNLLRPFLIKLDTHGFEVPILRGAAATLAATEALIIEAYNFKLAPESLLFHEMCSYMKELGFRCVDLVDVLHRRHDGALWQMDLVFVRESRPEFTYSEYD